ncbi:ROK family protein [Clostridium felsineum]|uniref:ROK family protein n=1 Tax=Clostridium felsineum TaxID=36839 RepID=UPI00214DE086|nr:ROK family protein [Clostridium felsineum]MCR3759540.1 ROK family protein [Clostridium felsineum]
MEFLVLDVGGTDIKYAIMNEKAEIIEKEKTKTPRDNIENFIETIGTIFDKYKNRVKGIAMSMPGRIDSKRGYLYSGGSLEYNNDKEIAEILKKRCPMPIAIENDGKCAALAEAWKGNLKEYEDGIVVIIGTGIGGGIIKDKKLHKGKHFIAGEFSFILTNDEMPDPKNNFAAAWAVTGGTPSLCKKLAEVKKLKKEIDGFTVFKYVNEGDEEAIKVLDDYCYKMAVQLYNLQYIYDPEKIAIGGGISQQKVLIEYIRKNIEKYAENMAPMVLFKPDIIACKFYNDSNLIGALYNYMLKYNINDK